MYVSDRSASCEHTVWPFSQDWSLELRRAVDTYAAGGMLKIDAMGQPFIYPLEYRTVTYH